ncbi:hypothetical protein EZY14_000265 [Kordia sp. TARA_039_SRF]|nr:hypothetical protein EZY14_000265 [Kordia sp. TARA_039_SRF]
MKIHKSWVYILCIIFFFSCESDLTGEMIVEKVLENAHGGKEAWQNVKTIIYEKTTMFYDSLGNEERTLVQTFHNTFSPEFLSIVTWTENGIRKKIITNEETTNVFENGELQLDAAIIQKARSDIHAAHYAFWQPYKLITDEVALTFDRKVRLEDGTKAYAVKATYQNSDDEWWYYFDVNTGLFVEALVKHGETYSQIKNVEHETATGLKLHKERKSYFVDLVKDQKYLRAHYFYKIIDLN